MSTIVNADSFDKAYDNYLTTIWEYGVHNTSKLGSEFLGIIVSELPLDEKQYNCLYHTGKLPIDYFKQFSDKDANCYIKIWQHITTAYHDLLAKYKQYEPEIDSAIENLWLNRLPEYMSKGLNLGESIQQKAYSSLQLLGDNHMSSWYEVYLLDCLAINLSQLGYKCEYSLYSYKGNQFLTLYSNVHQPLKHFCNFVPVDFETYKTLLKGMWIKDLDYQLQTNQQWGMSYTKQSFQPKAWQKLKITDEDIILKDIVLKEVE